jgi:hypothetical protein
MGNYELQREVNRLESELHRCQQINYQLKGELNTLANGVSSARNTLENYNSFINNVLDNSDSRLMNSHQKIIHAYETQGEIKRLYARFKNIETANKKIRSANNSKYYDFKNYRTVRKILSGLMENIDVNMISDQTILKSVEVQHLKSPDYWLTFALISIMSWKRDDKILAEHAMNHALRLDKKNASIFYMLFNIRLERFEASLKWFELFKECELNGKDKKTLLLLFTLVSDSIDDFIDQKSKKYLNDFIHEVIETNVSNSGFSKEQIVDFILQKYSLQYNDVQVEYPLLKKSILDYDRIKYLIDQTSKNVKILELLNKISKTNVKEKNEFLKKYIDELISEPNDQEINVFKIIEFNELIIKYQGDVESAVQDFAEKQKNEREELNLIAEMTRWIFSSDNKEVNSQVRKNIFILTKGYFKQAYEEFTNDYRSRLSHSFDVQIDDYRSNINFADIHKEDIKIDEFYNNKLNIRRAQLKGYTEYIAFGIGALLIIGSFFAGFGLIIPAIIAFGYGAVELNSKSNKIKEITFAIDNEKIVVKKLLSEIKDEFNRFLTDYHNFDDFSSEIEGIFTN